jgi:DNA-binding CsgD family transcriptional regulator
VPEPEPGARVSRLSEREREVLRLLSRGHDSKSAAAALGLTPSAVSERLREARRKLDVTSSREAARILAAAEGGAGKRVDMLAGLGRSAQLSPGHEGQRRLAVYGIGGLMMIAILAGALGLWATSNGSGYAAPPAVESPRVIRTSPRQGEVIAPGPFAISITYGQSMQSGAYSFVQISPETFPDCEHDASRSPDGRTYTMRCNASPGRRYEVWFNRPPDINFKATDGQPAEPYQLLFRSR